jgi:hypothetical protein
VGYVGLGRGIVDCLGLGRGLVDYVGLRRGVGNCLGLGRGILPSAKLLWALNTLQLSFIAT